MVLSIGHLLPYGPPLLYDLVEGIALALALRADWRWHARLGDAVLLHALVPLFFAFRSLPSYFAFAPWLAVYAVQFRSNATCSPPPSIGHSLGISPAS